MLDRVHTDGNESVMSQKKLREIENIKADLTYNLWLEFQVN